MNESLALAKNIADISYADLPQNVVDVTKKSILDALAVTLAAGTLGEGCKAFVDLAIEAGGKEESTIIGFDAKVPSHMATFANGAMAHALDFEDAHDGATVHANAAAVPAALAIAESVGGVNGKDLITAVALGSDLVARLGLALTVSPLEYGWYWPPIFGAFGAATAVSKLLDLSPPQILDAFSLTLCQATCSAEIIFSPDSLIRAIRDAFAAKAGLLSAQLARRNVTGFGEPFEGRAGLFAMYARGNYNPSLLVRDLGRTFEGAHVSFKPWPSCRGTHSCIDAALRIIRTHEVRPSDVEEVRVVVGPVNRMLCEPLESKRKPATAIDAKFSLPFTVAEAIVHGRVSLASFAAEALSDREVLQMTPKVACEIDPSLTATKGSVSIRTRGGEVLSQTVDVPYGHPRNPLSEETFIAKFVDCAKYARKKFSAESLDRVVGLTLALEKLDDVAELMRYL